MINAQCAIDSNKKFIEIVEDINVARIHNDRIIQTAPPVITEQQEAFWNGKGWSVQKIIKPAPEVNAISTPIQETEDKIEDSEYNAPALNFLNVHLSMLNFQILQKIEKNKKIPKKWNEYKKVLLKNIERCKTEEISKDDITIENKPEDPYQKIYDHYQKTNYDTNSKMFVRNGYDLDYMNKVLNKDHSFFEILKESIVYTKQLENSFSSMYTGTQLGEIHHTENGKSKFMMFDIERVCDRLPDDFEKNYRKIEIIEKNNIDDFVKKYESQFKRFSTLFKIPSFVDFLEDRFIYSKDMKYKRWMNKFGISGIRAPSPFFIQYSNIILRESSSETTDYNLFFQNLENINELISAEVDMKQFSKKELNPKKPIPRN